MPSCIDVLSCWYKESCDDFPLVVEPNTNQFLFSSSFLFIMFCLVTSYKNIWSISLLCRLLYVHSTFIFIASMPCCRHIKSLWNCIFGWRQGVFTCEANLLQALREWVGVRGVSPVNFSFVCSKDVNSVVHYFEPKKAIWMSESQWLHEKGSEVE